LPARSSIAFEFRKKDPAGPACTAPRPGELPASPLLTRSACAMLPSTVGRGTRIKSPTSALRQPLNTPDLHGYERFERMQNHYDLVPCEEERKMNPLRRDQGIGLRSSSATRSRRCWLRPIRHNGCWCTHETRPVYMHEAPWSVYQAGSRTSPLEMRTRRPSFDRRPSRAAESTDL
jgi:hypothetical protein